MKQKLISLLCACLILSGCGISSSEPIQTDAPPTETLATATQLPLLDQGSLLEENYNLRYIPNAVVEAMTAPEVRLFGNGLLLSECNGDTLSLNIISLEDGTLAASGSVPAKDGTKLSIGSGEIGICDRVSGQITILDEQFHHLQAYDVPGEGDEWFLNSELDTLYIFFYDRGLLARNLLTGEDLWLVDDGFQVKPTGNGNGYVIFEYTDRADQKTYSRYLNLSTATLETLPIRGAVSGGTRLGETWLIQSISGNGYHTLVDHDASCSIVWTDSEIRLLSPKRHLLATDPSGRNLMLFESDGSFLSQCSLPMSSDALTGSDFVWSGYWEGYFFTDFMDGTYRLMFWDVNAPCAGDDLQMLPIDQVQPPQHVVESSLYERAAQLSQRFGVDIRIAEQCTLDYSHYDSYALTDPTFIRSALDILEAALSKYPEGFFRQLTYGSIESIRIELVGSLMLRPDVTTHTDNAGAFAQNRGSYYGIVLNGFLMTETIIYHEFSHIIDSRLEWNALIHEDALYSEETWLALQPEGFQFAMSYVNIPEELHSYLETDYFISDYSITYPTEDRATLIVAAMEQNLWDFESGSGRHSKMQYYADCIRDCFDTTGWPETTLWEQVLK